MQRERAHPACHEAQGARWDWRWRGAVTAYTSGGVGGRSGREAKDAGRAGRAGTATWWVKEAYRASCPRKWPILGREQRTARISYAQGEDPVGISSGPGSTFERGCMRAGWASNVEEDFPQSKYRFASVKLTRTDHSLPKSSSPPSPRPQATYILYKYDVPCSTVPPLRRSRE